MFVCFFPFLYMTTPTTYGSSRARGGWIQVQLPAYTTVTAALDLSCICDLYCSLWQHGIKPDSSWTLCQDLNSLSHKNSLWFFGFIFFYDVFQVDHFINMLKEWSWIFNFLYSSFIVPYKRDLYVIFVSVSFKSIKDFKSHSYHCMYQ